MKALCKIYLKIGYEAESLREAGRELEEVKAKMCEKYGKLIPNPAMFVETLYSQPARSPEQTYSNIEKYCDKL